jgi:hypothetical protein
VTASVDTALSPRDREVLAGLADLLIPASSSMPAASDAGVHEAWLDAVLASRPDLLQPLVSLLRAADGTDPIDALTKLREQGGFGILAEVVPNAYFMNPEIRRRIGYSLQEAVPIDPADGQDAEVRQLLDSVRQRGAIFRPSHD